MQSASKVARSGRPLRQAGNLKIAKTRSIILNVEVDLSFTQPSHERLPNGEAGITL
jgi:hypothetical protein